MSQRPVPEGKYVEIGDGLRVHYHESGEGPVVVFLHGSGPGASGWSNFHHNVPAFVAAGFRVLLPDTLGYGYSSKPDSVDYTFDLLEGAVERFHRGAGRDGVLGRGQLPRRRDDDPASRCGGPRRCSRSSSWRPGASRSARST